MGVGQWLGLAVAAAILCMVVRAQQPQLANVCAMAAGLMILLSALDHLQEVQSTFARLSVLGGLKEGYVSVLLKVLGVSYAAELAAQSCVELGEKGLALKVGLAGKLCVFSITSPMLIQMLEMILELVP